MLRNVHIKKYEPRRFADCFVGELQQCIDNKNVCAVSVVQNIESISKFQHSNLIMSTKYLFLPDLKKIIII